MQKHTRLATLAYRGSNRTLSSSSSIANNHNWSLPFWRSQAFSSSTHRTADPALHSGEPENLGEGIDADEAPKSTAARPEQDKQKPTIEVEGIKHQSVKPATPSSKLESSGVNPPIDPLNQQKRHYSPLVMSSSSQGSSQPPPPPSIEDVSCVGMDGTPLHMDDDEQRQEDNKEYYKHHKPSPLGEMEMADTRKPITRATDGGAGSGYFGGGPDVIGWSEEQLETADETLNRASLIFKESAMRDDPDSPQSRALRRAMLEQSKSMSSANY